MHPPRLTGLKGREGVSCSLFLSLPGNCYSYWCSRMIQQFMVPSLSNCWIVNTFIYQSQFDPCWRWLLCELKLVQRLIKLCPQELDHFSNQFRVNRLDNCPLSARVFTRITRSSIRCLMLRTCVVMPKAKGRLPAPAPAARTTRYCLQVMEKIREVDMKMSPHGFRPFSSTSWVAWMVGSVNLSRSLDSW